MFDQLINEFLKPENVLKIFGAIVAIFITPFLYNKIVQSIRTSNRKSNMEIAYEQVDIDNDHEFEISFLVLNNSDQDINFNGFDLVVESFKYIDVYKKYVSRVVPNGFFSFIVLPGGRIWKPDVDRQYNVEAGGSEKIALKVSSTDSSFSIQFRVEVEIEGSTALSKSFCLFFSDYLDWLYLDSNVYREIQPNDVFAIKSSSFDKLLTSSKLVPAGKFAIYKDHPKHDQIFIIQEKKNDTILHQLPEFDANEIADFHQKYPDIPAEKAVKVGLQHFMGVENQLYRTYSKDGIQYCVQIGLCKRLSENDFLTSKHNLFDRRSGVMVDPKSIFVASFSSDNELERVGLLADADFSDAGDWAIIKSFEVAEITRYSIFIEKSKHPLFPPITEQIDSGGVTLTQRPWIASSDKRTARPVNVEFVKFVPRKRKTNH